MSEFKCGVVIPVGQGRRENVEECLEWLFGMTTVPETVILVLDGHDELPGEPPGPVGVQAVRIPKHEPGMEQPRNVGVRMLKEHSDCTHAWFLDSDIIVDPDALLSYEQTVDVYGGGNVMIGPYEWLAPGQRAPLPELRNDPRWAMFDERLHEGPVVAHLGVALGCFGGNLVWPIDEFIRVGGFHPQLHHGRCEDGELGLRAASLRVPMKLVPQARGWHLYHDVNMQLAQERNARDVPLLNSWHPWVEQQGLIVTDQDGARFDYVCACGEQVNTLEMWAHLGEHRKAMVTQPQSELILPDGMA